MGNHHPLRISIHSKAGLQEARLRFDGAKNHYFTSRLLPPDTTGTVGDHLLTSLEYHYALTAVSYNYTAAYFLHRRWREIGDPADKASAKQYIQDWAASWKDYRERIPTLPGAATLYSNNGMELTMARIVKDLK